jgi:hypothetical protein
MHRLAITPSKKEFEIYRRVWNELDNNPGLDEDKIIDFVSTFYNKGIREIDKILIKVSAFKEIKKNDCLEELVERLKKNKIKTKNIKCEELIDSIYIDLKTCFNMNSLIENEINANSVKIDLINTAEIVFEVLPFMRVLSISLLFSGLSSTLVEDNYRNLGTVEFRQELFNPSKLKEKNLFEIFS